MASKLTIKEESGGENMPLYYAVYDDAGRQVSMHYAREDAELMAAAPELRSDLRTALEYIAMIHKSEPGDAELDCILSALKRAKGE
jgi:TfoX/Sxy family transcriptional regulator of competence genes